jgi:hypothetical protein
MSVRTEALAELAHIAALVAKARTILKRRVSDAHECQIAASELYEAAKAYRSLFVDEEDDSDSDDEALYEKIEELLSKDERR